jgi:mRNA interferase YafQ
MTTKPKYKIKQTTQFKKDIKRLKSRGKNFDRFKKILEKITMRTKLPPRACDHPLKGLWVGFRDCHIDGDWIVIYKVDDKNLTVTFARTGTHQDLFRNY